MSTVENLRFSDVSGTRQHLLDSAISELNLDHCSAFLLISQGGRQVKAKQKTKRISYDDRESSIGPGQFILW